MKLLIERGANVNAGIEKDTPLMLATMKGIFLFI